MAKSATSKKKKHRSFSAYVRWFGNSIIGDCYRWLQGLHWLCVLPLFLLLLITSTDFLILTNVSDTAQSLFFEELPVPYNDSRRDMAEEQKAGLLQYVYVFLLFVCALQWRKIVGYFMNWPHLIIIVAYLFLGVFYSIDPVKIITNSIIIAVGFLSAVVFTSANTEPRRYDGFYQVVFWPMLLIHISSLFILSLYEVNLVEFLQSTQRYGGLAGNPNSLGSTAVLGVWAGAGIVLSSTSSLSVRIIGFLGLLIFFFNTMLSGSGTSTAAIIVVLFALIWLRILAAFRPRTRLMVNGFLALTAFFGLLYALLVSTPSEMFLAITGSMGKDATLSGRTELWTIAREAISLKPWFGWGFDSHQSVMAERAFDVRFNHYHNGFLDTIVAGGFILLALVLYNLGRFAIIFVQTFREEKNVFPLILPLIILIVLNMSEYSLLRPNSQLWLVYFIAFVMLTYSPVVNVSLRFKLGKKGQRRSSTRRKRGEKMRWG